MSTESTRDDITDDIIDAGLLAHGSPWSLVREVELPRYPEPDLGYMFYLHDRFTSAIDCWIWSECDLHQSRPLEVLTQEIRPV